MASSHDRHEQIEYESESRPIKLSRLSFLLSWAGGGLRSSAHA